MLRRLCGRTRTLIEMGVHFVAKRPEQTGLFDEGNLFVVKVFGQVECD